jgi:hypothetical protein
MAGPESLLHASEVRAAPEFGYADVTSTEVRERHLAAGELQELHASRVTLSSSLQIIAGGAYTASYHAQPVTRA